VKTKTSLGFVAIAIGGLVFWWFAGREPTPPSPVVAKSPPPVTTPLPPPAPAPPRHRTHSEADVPPPDRDVIDGRVLDAVTRQGVANAELTFGGDSAVSTFSTSSDGTFVLTPPPSGALALSTITAPGFLPYVSELDDTGVRLTLTRGPAVHGVTLVLQPAIDYRGLVVDARGAPVAGARVRLISDRAELDGPTAWTSGRDGEFTFQAADDAMLEASQGGMRGWARLYRLARIDRKLTIRLSRASPRDATISGHVREPGGAPVADARVRATTGASIGNPATVVATTGPDGAFTLIGVDRTSYDLTAAAADHLDSVRANVLGGSRNVELTLEATLPLAGRVIDDRGAPVPAFTLVVQRRFGMARSTITSPSVIDPAGRFAVRVPAGDYELVASATGFARGEQTPAAAGATDLQLRLDHGRSLRGQVVSSNDHAPIGDATVTANPGDAGGRLSDPHAITDGNGMFTLAELPGWPLTLKIRAPGFHDKIDAMVVPDRSPGAPITIELTPVGPDEQPLTERTGIGIQVSGADDGLRVFGVVPGGGAADAGIAPGDTVIAIDGAPVAPLGMEAAFARILGPVNTTVTLTLVRDGHQLQVAAVRHKFWSDRSPARGTMPP